MTQTVTQAERITFTQDLIAHCLPADESTDWEEIADRLITLGRRYHRIQERWCNEEMDDETTTRVEGRERGIEAEVREIVTKLGLQGVDLDGDPRGATIKLLCPDGYYDDWGHKGLCVPGS